MYTIIATSKAGGRCEFSHPDSNIVFEFMAMLIDNSNWVVIAATGPDGKTLNGFDKWSGRES